MVAEDSVPIPNDGSGRHLPAHRSFGIVSNASVRPGVACGARSFPDRRAMVAPEAHDERVIDIIATENRIPVSIPGAHRRHSCFSPSRSSVLSALLHVSLLCSLLSMITCAIGAEVPTASGSGTIVAPATAPATATQCLPGGKGFLRARLSGALKTEIAWGNETDCSGAIRPTDGGIRMRFAGMSTAVKEPGKSQDAERLVLVFGIAGLREGQSAQSLGVNLTVIREGTGQFYSTRGDDKCTLDKVTQVPIVGIPRRSRSYSLVARGFCTEPARAVRGEGVILISRFDFAGRVDFDTEDNGTEPQTATASL